MSVTEQAYWYGFLIMSATYMKQFTSCISAANSSRVVSYFVVLLILIGYSFLCLWMSKNKFGKTLHILNIVIVSTYLIFELSELFSYYYIYVYDIEIPITKPFVFSEDAEGNMVVGFGSKMFSYIKYSMRYFFEFPPQEYVDMVTILQFIIGKVYEAVLIGAAISGLSSAFMGKKEEK